MYSARSFIVKNRRFLVFRRITATFFDEKDKSEKTVQVTIGESLMEAAHANDIDLEGKSNGSCSRMLCLDKQGAVQI